jgi:Zn-dependent protease/CBS domain-containing protein
VSNTGPGRQIKSGLVLGRFRGVPIEVMPSWLLVGVLLAAVYGPIIDDAVPDLGAGLAYLAGIGFAALFGFCILAHELGHTIVSLALGHPVRRVVLFALGGVSEVEGEPERARDELLIAGTGPVVSLVISGAAWLAYDASPAGALSTALLGLLCWTNLLLAGFNLLPGLPLDGGRILRAAVCAFGARPVTGTRVAAVAGRAVAIGVAASGLAAQHTSLGFSAAIFSFALAAYLWMGAGQSLKVAQLMATLPGVAVAELVRPGMFIPSDLTVNEALRRAWESQARGLVLVDPAEQPTAIVDEVQIGAVPPERRPWTPVSTVARPLEPGLMVPDGIDAEALLRRMQTTPAREYLVVRPDGSPAGIITTRDFAQRLQAFAASKAAAPKGTA